MLDCVADLLQDVDDGGLRRFSKFANGVEIYPLDRVSLENSHLFDLLC